MKTFALALALLTTSVWASSADDALDNMPGYVDLAALSADYGEPRVTVNIGSSLLKLVSAMKQDDPVAEEALKNLESVRVNVYNTAGNTRPAAARMQSVSNTLAAQDWDQIVQVREIDEQVDIYVKHGNDRIQGLVVMAVDSEEAVFINILGDIDPAQLSSVMHHIDIDMDVDVDL
jgi:hypothetical protein